MTGQRLPVTRRGVHILGQLRTGRTAKQAIFSNLARLCLKTSHDSSPLRTYISNSSAQNSGPLACPQSTLPSAAIAACHWHCLAMLPCLCACPLARKPFSFLLHCHCLPEQPPPRTPWTRAPTVVCAPRPTAGPWGSAVFSLQLRGLAQCLKRGSLYKPKSRGSDKDMCVHACVPGALLPVIGGQLAASDVWHGGDPTALVLPVPNGTGHLQHTQDTPVPKTRGEHSDSIRQITGPQHLRCDLKSRNKWKVQPAEFTLLTSTDIPDLTHDTKACSVFTVVGHQHACCPGTLAQLHTKGNSAPLWLPPMWLHWPNLIGQQPRARLPP